MSMKYFIDDTGKYLGGWEFNQPEGAIEVPYAPYDARQIWLGDKWGDIPTDEVQTNPIDKLANFLKNNPDVNELLENFNNV